MDQEEELMSSTCEKVCVESHSGRGGRSFAIEGCGVHAQAITPAHAAGNSASPFIEQHLHMQQVIQRHRSSRGGAYMCVCVCV